MQIVIDIPEEQVKKSLEESKYINTDEGEKGSVHIAMLYTNAQLEFVTVERKTDFYSCKYKILPKGHGRLIDADAMQKYQIDTFGQRLLVIDTAPTIIKAESEEEGR